jgi:hypothetical protein
VSRDLFEGCIAGAGFASGDAVIVGAWRASPFGTFVDVMWRRPDGERVLLAPTPAIANYVAALYRFDRVEVTGITGGWDGESVAVEAGGLRIRLQAGHRGAQSWLFALRPRVLRRRPWWVQVEERLARPVIGRVIGGAQGVRAAGIAPGGQREYYSVDDYRRVVAGELTVGGRDAGALRCLPADLGVGLSAFPTVPAVVYVGTFIESLRDGGPGSAGLNPSGMGARLGRLKRSPRDETPVWDVP